jgi:hypothetical protein
MFEPEPEDMRTWKALPLLVSFLAAILIPVVIAIVFGIIGSKTNALLMQFEIILVIIGFCLTGILTRSKLKGFLSIVAAPISWVILFLIETITGGWILNPFGLFTGLATPLASILESGILGEGFDPALIEIITQAAIIIDLIIIEILAFFLGFLLAALATGIWKKNGEISIFSIIMKPIAAILTILILILVPFTYHGLANFADGGISMGAGFAEFLGFFGEEFGGGGGAQAGGIPLDLNDPEVIENLTKAAENAEYWFRRSSRKFGQVQGNFLITAIINALFPEGQDYEGINMREIRKVLDIADVFADVSGGLPYLLAGYQNMARGFNLTFSVLAESSIGGGSGSAIESITAEYNPDYSLGLHYIDAALDNFTDAEDFVVYALETAQGIVDDVIINQEGEFGDIADIIDEAQIGYSVIIEVARGGIPFLNATYETTLAVDELGETDFEEANTWMSAAALDLSSANSILQAIDTSDLNSDSPLPFYGSAEIIKDMTNLLTYFSIAAANGTSCYLAIEDALEALDALDFSGGGVLGTDWNDLSTAVSAASYIFDMTDGNMTAAGSFSDSLTDKSYGPIMDGSLKPMLNDFSQMINQFASNITEIGYQLTGLEKTVFSIQSFTEGVDLFNQTWNELRITHSGDGPAFLAAFNSDLRINRSEDLLDFSITNASNGHTAIGNALTIPSTTRTNWQNTLYKPTPPTPPDKSAIPPSIAGLSQGVLDAIAAIRLLSVWSDQGEQNGLVQAFFDNMDNIGLESIFGGGG